MAKADEEGARCGIGSHQVFDLAAEGFWKLSRSSRNEPAHLRACSRHVLEDELSGIGDVTGREGVEYLERNVIHGSYGALPGIAADPGGVTAD